MAYCLRSFVETLDQILHPKKHHKNWVLAHDKIPQIQSLFEYASFLCNFLDESSPLIQQQIATLEDEIMQAAEKGANALESHITSQILSIPEGQSFMISPPDLGDVLHVFEVAKQKLIKIKDAAGQPLNQTVSPPVSSTRHLASKNAVVVGVEDDLKELGIRLTSGWTKTLDIIPIVGMGGMGKTTLARILFDKYSSIKSQFDCCAWVTVSQSYDPKHILQTLLDETVKSLSKVHEQAEPETENSLNKMPEQNQITVNSLNEKPEQKDKDVDLVVALRKKLFSRRYLIVIDDIWSSKAWDDVQRAFPKDSPGSRIILTTRENTIVDYVKSKSHEMHLMNKDDSWELIKGKVFGDQSCPEELEEVGKTISSSCGGLPLALQVIGGLLSESPRSREFWEYVAHDVGSLIVEKDDQFSGIFSWSFAHLPHYLKPCFLYMGAFPEDHHIGASKIVKLWVSEGFLKPIGDKILEEVAEIYLQALVDRNLIFVRATKKRSMQAKSYGIHDLLRDLCLQKAQEKLFLNHVKDPETNNPQEDMLWFRRVSIHSSPKHLPSLKLTPHARSFLSIHVVSDEIISCLCFNLSLLRVLDMFGLEFPKFPELILQLVNLRYLAVDADIPRSISMLRNLQTLIAHKIDSIAVISDLPQLRHLIVKWKVGCCECYKCSSGSDCSPFDLHENLRTLSLVKFRALKKLCGKLPNLRKLKMEKYWGDDNSLDILETVKSFYNLETLKISMFDPFPQNPKPNFPDSLKKLTLSCLKLSQSLLDAIGLLPNLQILILESCYFKSSDWETCEGGFPKLRYLHIKKAKYLENLLATENDFPVLQHLVVESCDDLNEIPYEIGGIETLEIIEVLRCKPSLLASARRILEEQRKLGNDSLQLYLGSEFELDEYQQLSIKSYTFTSQTTLPHFLRNLTLQCCRVPQTLLSANDEHPEFQLLNIEYCRFESSTWEPFEGVFFKIQYLKIVESDLSSWIATEIHFPVLRHLVIRDCCHLKAIPNNFGKIKTLEIIEVDGCKQSVFESARRVLEEQYRFGNNRLHLRLGRAIDVWSCNKEGVQGESLISKVENHGMSVYGYDLSRKTIFPRSLEKLTLRFCEVPQTILNAIGALPNIEVLKLTNCSFESEDWEPFEGAFCELQYLHIDKVRNLANWLATESNFPVLQHLVLQDCSHLNMIPSEIGGNETLKIIEVARCKPSVFLSARRILERQRKSYSKLQLLLGSEFEMDKSYRLSLFMYNFNSETIFPHFLRNLTLEYCRVPKAILGANNDLPEFQVLNIETCHIECSTWEPCEGVFFQLQFLKIEDSNLKNWLGTEIHFPALRHLVIQDCRNLSEIPNFLGRVKTLEIINVDLCKHSVFESARIILEEQRQFGNTRLQLQLGRATDGWSFKEYEKVVEEEESLICKVENHGLTLYNISNKTIFPHSLRKLTLRFCELTRTILSAIGDLLEIQILKVRNCRFESSTWMPSQYEFVKLLYLEIAESNLENLLAADFPFPALQHLFLYDCPYLIEIPSGIGEIHSLKLIEVDECRPSLFDSAKMIFEKRPQHGNNDLELLLGRAIDVWSSKEEEESLIRKVENQELSLHHYIFTSNTIFPRSLKKLTLRSCKVPQTALHAIGFLPEIQDLKLTWCSFESSTWEPYEYGFCQLQYLEISHSNLENWLANNWHFPVLQHLILDDCLYLNEIPLEIGDINPLESIEVNKCNPSVFDSAKRIREEQLMYGNSIQLLFGSAIDGSRYDLEDGNEEESQDLSEDGGASTQNTDGSRYDLEDGNEEESQDLSEDGGASTQNTGRRKKIMRRFFFFGQKELT